MDKAAVFTDAPELSSRVLPATIQFIGWIVAHPQAWAAWMRRHMAHLSAQPLLWEFWQALPKQHVLRRSMMLLLFGWPCVWALLTAFVVWQLGQGWYDIWFCALTVGLGCAIAGLLMSLTVSVFAGCGMLFMLVPLQSISYILSTVFIKQPIALLIVRITLGKAVSPPNEVTFMLLAYCLVVAFTAGWCGQLLVQCITPSLDVNPGARQLGAIVLGLMITTFTYGITISILGWGVFTILISLVVGIGIQTVFRSASTWRYALVVGAVTALIYMLVAPYTHRFAEGAIAFGWGTLLAVIMGSIWLGSFFVFPYAIGVYVAGQRAGAIAGVLSLGAIYIGGVYVVAQRQYSDTMQLMLLLLNFGVIGAGWLFPYWRPVLTYPFQTVFHLWLYRADERQLRQPPYLRYHSVFWDRHQWLSFPGLVDHLVLIAERDPATGQAALAFLLDSPYRNSARKVQLELDVRCLEQCTSCADIAAVSSYLDVPDMLTAEGTVLRNLAHVSQDVQTALQQMSSYNQRLALKAIEDRLDGILRDIIRGSDSARFIHVVTTWRTFINAYRAELGALVHQQRLIESPYIVGVPLTKQQELFVGRTRISEHIEHVLMRNDAPPLLVYGQRRMGKTSLLNNLERLLPRSIVPIFIDAQGSVSQATTSAGFLVAMARAIRLSLDRQHYSVAHLSREDVQEDAFVVFEEWLDTIDAALDGALQLWLLDEFDALEYAFEQDRLERDAILGWLRHLIQHRPHLKILIAGSYQLTQLHQVATYFVNISAIHLSYLEPDNARALIEHPVPDFALSYTPDAVEYMLRLTRCHPALVQLCCAELIALKNTQPTAQRFLAEVADVEAIIPAALERGGFFFTDLALNHTTPLERTLLCAIAQQGFAVPLQALVQMYGDAVEPALLRLVQLDILDYTQGYVFQVELIRQWFVRFGHQF